MGSSGAIGRPAHTSHKRPTTSIHARAFDAVLVITLHCDACYTTSCLHVGQLLLFSLSHTSTQPLWKRCAQGIVRSSSPSTKSSKQIEHWFWLLAAECCPANTQTGMRSRISLLVHAESGASTSDVVAARSNSKTGGCATSRGVNPSAVRFVVDAPWFRRNCTACTSPCCAAWCSAVQRPAGWQFTSPGLAPTSARTRAKS
mmetsp:Transcript_41624/g.115885  ORF Transcript_41624/g.115885 Transcript_41624/m.115885 type:complete len:201 (+) Transcript_41624:114-716(+)